MSSNPSTPLSQRRMVGGGAQRDGSRIPQLTSPQPFRRSVSLRLRGSKSATSSNFASPTSPPKPLHMSRPLEHARTTGKTQSATTESIQSGAKEALPGPSCNHHHHQFCDGHRPSQLQSPSAVPTSHIGAHKRDHGLVSSSAPLFLQKKTAPNFFLVKVTSGSVVKKFCKFYNVLVIVALYEHSVHSSTC